MAVAFNKFYQFAEDLAHGVHILSTDTLKIMLTDSAPVATNTVKANITEITAVNGYAAGGAAVSVTSCVQTLGLLKLILADVTITASGGSFGPFRYVVLYNDSPTSPADPLIGWWDIGSEKTILSGDAFVGDFDPSAGALTIQ